MKIFLLFLLVFNGCYLISSAQDSNRGIDSLTLLLTNVKNDTTRVMWSIALAENLRHSHDLEKATDYARDALLLSEKIGFKRGIAISNNDIGQIYGEQGDYIAALKNYFIALQVYKEMDNKKGIINTNYNIITCYYQLGNYEEALKYCFDNLNIETKMGDAKALANIHTYIGNIYEKQGNYPEALKNHLTALKGYEENNDRKRIADSYNNIGIVYAGQGNYEEALSNYSHALKIAEDEGYKQGMAFAYNNSGILYSKKGNYNEAVRNYTVALKIQETIGDKQSIVAGYINLGDMFVHLKKFPDAQEYLNKGLALSSKTGYKFGIAASDITLGEMYIQMQKLNEANEFLNKALAFAKEGGIKNLTRDCYADLSRMDSMAGNFKGSNQYMRLYDAIKDSILNEETSHLVLQYKVQYETEKKDKEIALLNSENKIKDEEVKQQAIIIYLAFSFAALTILIGFLFFNNYRIKNKARQLTEANELRQKISGDLHDEIGAGLTLISMACEQAKINTPNRTPNELISYDKISSQSRDLSEKLSEVVWATNPENDNLQSLLSYIRNYVSKFFEDSTINYSLELPEQIPNLFLKPNVSRNLYFVLKEALNNCVKHSQATFIEIQLQVDAGKNYKLVINDNGKGIDYDSIPMNRSGLGNMRRRMEEINGSLNVKSEVGKGTYLEIKGNLL